MGEPAHVLSDTLSATTLTLVQTLMTAPCGERVTRFVKTDLALITVVAMKDTYWSSIGIAELMHQLEHHLLCFPMEEIF